MDLPTIESRDIAPVNRVQPGAEAHDSREKPAADRRNRRGPRQPPEPSAAAEIDLSQEYRDLVAGASDNSTQYESGRAEDGSIHIDIRASE